MDCEKNSGSTQSVELPKVQLRKSTSKSTSLTLSTICNQWLPFALLLLCFATFISLIVFHVLHIAESAKQSGSKDGGIKEDDSSSASESDTATAANDHQSSSSAPKSAEELQLENVQLKRTNEELRRQVTELEKTIRKLKGEPEVEEAVVATTEISESEVAGETEEESNTTESSGGTSDADDTTELEGSTNQTTTTTETPA